MLLLVDFMFRCSLSVLSFFSLFVKLEISQKIPVIKLFCPSSIYPSSFCPSVGTLLPRALQIII